MTHVFDSELRIMKPLWDNGPMTAGAIAKLLKENVGWKRNTTYTVITKLVNKGMIMRSEPGFVCTPLVSREQVQSLETSGLIDRLFDGSRSRFLAAFLSEELQQEDADSLHALIDSLS